MTRREPGPTEALARALVVGVAIVVGLLLLAEADPSLWLLATLVVLAWVAGRVRNRLRLRRAVIRAVDQHRGALIRRRAQLLRTDAYGAEQPAQWMKEIEHFISTQIAPSLRPRHHKMLRRRHAAVVQLIAVWTAAEAIKSPALQTVSDIKTGVDFELFCAEELRRAGWSARLTPVTGDQGADLIAAKNGVSVVLQCKFHSRPVGNRAVQEIVGARGHEHADHAAVVSNRSYTPAAEQLAQTNSVLLLHHTQLAKLDILLGINKSIGARSPA